MDFELGKRKAYGNRSKTEDQRSVIRYRYKLLPAKQIVETTKRRPGHSPKRWLDQIGDDSQHPQADVRRDAVKRGHRGATQRSATNYAVITDERLVRHAVFKRKL